MSNKTRRERQKEATREGIVNAALSIAREQGWEAVTVRRVAELVEYTPPIIYEYFANKGALLEELQSRGFTALTARVQGALERGGEVRERALRMADTYIAFAYEQPELYQLMHGWNSAEVPLDDTLARATPLALIVQGMLEEWACEQGVTLAEPQAATEICWALLHGLVSVEMLGRIGGGQERVRLLARRALEAQLDSWAAQ